MQNKIKKVADLISIYSEKIQLFEKNRVLDIYTAWSAIVGEKIAAHTKLVDIEHHTAVIETDHTGWGQQLLLKKKWILRNLKKKYPQLEVESISIVVSSRYATKKQHIPVENKHAFINTRLFEQPVVVNSALPAEIVDALKRLKKSIIKNNRKEKLSKKTH